MISENKSRLLASGALLELKLAVSMPARRIHSTRIHIRAGGRGGAIVGMENTSGEVGEEGDDGS